LREATRPIRAEPSPLPFAGEVAAQRRVRAPDANATRLLVGELYEINALRHIGSPISRTAAAKSLKILVKRTVGMRLAISHTSFTAPDKSA
jgi:hypothetical protein